jgi:superfamily II DNA/RNA helicase
MKKISRSDNKMVDNENNDSVTEEISSETNSSENKTSEASVLVKHVFYEVENDLLSKPNALSSILHATNKPKTVVFCNTPSEADMVDVMLGKADIKTEKLIGNVPHSKLIQSCSAIADGSIQALIVTDVAASQLESEEFDLVVNYSIHEDPEIYIHRSSGLENEKKSLTVASLVSPLDFGNFHYLKKVVDFEIEKAELASSEELKQLRLEAFVNKAATSETTLNEEQTEILEKIKAHPEQEKILSFLLQKVLVDLPEAESKMNKKGPRGKYSKEDRGNRNDSRDRDSRNRDSRNRDSRNDKRDSNDRYERREQDRTPPKKDVRFYIGHGKEEGFNEEVLNKLIQKNCSELNAEIKRISVRDLYTFADFDAEISEGLLEKLSNTECLGKSFVCYHATKITRPKEESSSDKEEATSESKESEKSEDCSEEVAASAVE